LRYNKKTKTKGNGKYKYKKYEKNSKDKTNDKIVSEQFLNGTPALYILQCVT